MINVLINGFNGKMGQEVLNSINSSEDFNVSCGVDKNVQTNSNIPIYSDYTNIQEKVDVIIDFSVPVASLIALNYAKEKNIPIVIATTGFSNEQLDDIKTISKEIPIFHSSNMSFEVNVLADIVSKLSLLLPDSDIEIIDTHHRNKIDSPSGTSILLADKINEARNNSLNYQYNRHTIRSPRAKNEIGIHSIRGGTEVGKHTVTFLGSNESFEITHTVTSRSVFADGALKATKFLISKENGYYSMDNLVK